METSACSSDDEINQDALALNEARSSRVRKKINSVNVSISRLSSSDSVEQIVSGDVAKTSELSKDGEVSGGTDNAGLNKQPDDAPSLEGNSSVKQTTDISDVHSSSDIVDISVESFVSETVGTNNEFDDTQGSKENDVRSADDHVLRNNSDKAELKDEILDFFEPELCTSSSVSVLCSHSDASKTNLIDSGGNPDESSSSVAGLLTTKSELVPSNSIYATSSEVTDDDSPDKSLLPNCGSEQSGTTPMEDSSSVVEQTPNNPPRIAHSSLSENPTDDELLAELENEFSDLEIHKSLGSSVEGSAEFTALKTKYDALQKHLEHTLNQRKELEVMNTRLEQKLDAAIKQKHTVEREVDAIVLQHQEEVQEFKEKILALEEKSKQELLILQDEHLTKMEQLMKQYDDCVREKDGIVVRYAQAEQKNIDVQDRLVKAESRVKEWTKEREIALTKWHAMKADLKKSNELNQTLASDVSSLRKELEKQKELATSAEVKVKWQQNKIKAEQDTNKDTKAKLQELEDKLKELKKEELLTLDQVKSIFFVLQDVDEGKVPVEILQKMDQSDFNDILPIIRRGLHLFEMKGREVVTELKTLRDKIRCLELERLSQEDSLNSMRDSLYSQQQGNMNLKDRILQLETTEKKLKECETQLDTERGKVRELDLVVHDQGTEIEQLVKRETDQLEFTSRISEKNTQLLAENSRFMSEISATTSHLEETLARCKDVEEKNQQLVEELVARTTKADSEFKSLQEELQSEKLKLDDVKQKLEEAEDEMKTLKRRHASNMKDLSRQLQIANRRVADVKEVCSNGRTERDNTSLGSLGSHGGSCGSIDAVGVSTAGHSEPAAQFEEGRADEQNNKESLLQRIASLERSIRRKGEKIEFLNDHVDQLIEELHRKSRIIQGYVLREEAGTLVPESSDKNKALLAKKGGVMASLYASHTLDSGMTMGLSLEINRKLQALLEDALLKNIKLKEGMDTLGQEIEWLSRENKRLQQELERTSNQSNS